MISAQEGLVIIKQYIPLFFTEWDWFEIMFSDLKFFCELIILLRPQKSHLRTCRSRVGNLHSILLLKDVDTFHQRLIAFLLFLNFKFFFSCVDCRNCFCTFTSHSYDCKLILINLEIEKDKLIIFLYFKF